MGQFQSGRRRAARVEWDAPCRLAPRFRYRVVLSAEEQGDSAATGADLGRLFAESRLRGLGPHVAWVTNDLVYARWLSARLNWLAGQERASVEAWNRAENPGQSRWIRRRPDAPRG